MSPKEFRETTLDKLENNELYAFLSMMPGANSIEFSSSPKIHYGFMSISVEGVRILFQEDEFREKADMN